MIGRRGKVVSSQVQANEKEERRKKWKLEIEQDSNGEENIGSAEAADARERRGQGFSIRSPSRSRSRSTRKREKRKSSKPRSPTGRDRGRERRRSRRRRSTSATPKAERQADAPSPKESATKKGKSTDKEKKDKEFAWMDSSDDGEKSRSPSLGPPPAARDVESFSQMMRVADAVKKKAGKNMKKLDMSADELLDICQAAARSKFYDSELFQDLLAPLLSRCFRAGLDASEEVLGKPSEATGNKQFSVDGGLEIVCTLASLNAASALADVFKEAARALREVGNKLTKAQRRLIKEVYTSIDREADTAFLNSLGPSPDVANTEIRGSTKEGQSSDGLPMRPGQRICESYLKTGNCRSGIGCRWDHPEGFKVTFTSDGYPVRPWSPVCPYYMAMGTCDHKNTCKWHHPDKRDRKISNIGGGSIWIPSGGIR